MNENQLREKVINKIYKIIPQDIICILPNYNIIKQKYIESKNICNYKEYIKEEENLEYKISIIYTFSIITNNVEGLNKEMSFMTSEIRSEDGLKNLIEELQIKNENNKAKKEYHICIHFNQSNSIKIGFISNFILNNFKDDKYNYIFIVHINRNFNNNFNSYINKRISSLPDIYPDINQIFIDNLNGDNNIRLNEILTRDIRNILDEKKEYLKLDDDFNKILKKFVYE